MEGLTSERVSPPPTKSGLAFFAILLLALVPGMLTQLWSPIAGLAWTGACSLVLPAAIAAAGANVRIAPALGLRWPGLLPVLMGVPLGAAAVLASSPLMLLASSLLPQRWVSAFDIWKIFEGPRAYLAALVGVTCIVAPACEEIAFRGWLLTVVRTRHRAGPAIALSAGAFALLHMDPVRFAALLVPGALFGWMAYRAASVWPTIAAHAAHNSVGIALMIAGGERASGPPRAGDIAWALAVLLPIAAGLLAALVAGYRRVTPPAPAVADSLVPREPALVTGSFRASLVPAWLRLGVVIAVAAFIAIAMSSSHRQPASSTRHDVVGQGAPATTGIRPFSWCRAAVQRASPMNGPRSRS